LVGRTALAEERMKKMLIGLFAAVMLFPVAASAGECESTCTEMVKECKKGCNMIPMAPDAKAACPEQCNKTEKQCHDMCKKGDFDKPEDMLEDGHGHN